jgi:hypothetical protein
MLEYLKNTEREPFELELDIMYVVKSLLQEGWALGTTEFYAIMETIDVNE